MIKYKHIMVSIKPKELCEKLGLEGEVCTVSTQFNEKRELEEINMGITIKEEL